MRSLSVVLLEVFVCSLFLKHFLDSHIFFFHKRKTKLFRKPLIMFLSFIHYLGNTSVLQSKPLRELICSYLKVLNIDTHKVIPSKYPL